MGNEALKQLKKLMGAGTLAQKYHDIGQFMNAGCSMLYSGDVQWQVKMPKEVLQGEAESIDAALDHLRLMFEGFMQSTAPDTKVSLALKMTPVPKD